MHFWYFITICPWKQTWPFVWKKNLLYTSLMDALCKFGLTLAKWFLSRRWKCETNRSMAEQMNDRQSEKFIWAFSSSELKRERHKLRTWHKNKRETDRQRNNQRELYIGTSKDNERRRVCEHRALAKQKQKQTNTQHKKIISQTQSTFSAQFHYWIIQNLNNP